VVYRLDKTVGELIWWKCEEYCISIGFAKFMYRKLAALHFLLRENFSPTNSSLKTQSLSAIFASVAYSAAGAS
jgi:hypothetical protein